MAQGGGIGSVVAAVAAGLLVVPAAHAVSSRDAVRFLNEQRAEAGLPEVKVSRKLTRGCANHARYMYLNRRLEHGERRGRPGYTREGAEHEGSEVLSAIPYGSSGRNPWQNAPIHLYLMLGPEATRAGYGESHGYACMRMAGFRPQPPAVTFYSHPGNGAAKVPYAQRAAEAPYTPQQLAGIPASATTGPNILLYTRGFGAGVHASSFALTGPGGPVDAVLVDSTTQHPLGSGALWFPTGGVLIPRAPLDDGTTYRADVVWTDAAGATAVQTFSFTTVRGTHARVRRARIGGSRMRVTLECDDPDKACNGRAMFRTAVRWQLRSRGRPRRIAFGSGSYRLAPGQQATISVKLPRDARRLVRAVGSLELNGVLQDRGARRRTDTFGAARR